MRILIIGGSGMLGHRLLLQLRHRHDVRVTLRQDRSSYARGVFFDASNSYDRVEARDTDCLAEVLRDFRPEVLINAVGLVKQLSIAKESIPSIEINALLPHRLAALALTVDARVLHFSTDCVFSGRRGNYSEADLPDPTDLYGYTKLLGEIADAHCLTVRTSLIGHEIERKTSLVEWFVSQRGPVPGYSNAIFNGVTTIEMSRIVEMLLTRHPRAHGVWHVSSEPIDKYALLNLIKKHYGLDTKVLTDDCVHYDRSLDSTRFRERFDYQPPSWESMISEMSKLRDSKK